MQFQNHFRSILELPRPLRMGGQNYFHYFPSSHTSSRKNKLFYMKSSSSSTLTSVQFMCCNLCEWVCFPIPRSILVPAADQTELSPRVCLAWSLCWTSVHRTGTEVVWSLVLLRFQDPFLSHHDPVTFIKGTLNLRYVADTEHTAICHQ